MLLWINKGFSEENLSDFDPKKIQKFKRKNSKKIQLFFKKKIDFF